MILNNEALIALVALVRITHLTRFDRSGPVTGPETIEHLCVMQEEREHSAYVARLVSGLASAWLAEPPPTFPFLESQCQRAALSANFHSARDETPPARSGPTGGEARCIGGCLRTVKRNLCRFCAFFSAAFARLWMAKKGENGQPTPFNA
jgi:hypothetical protein